MRSPVRAVVTPGGAVSGTIAVPGDKSIAHRWLLLATIADGTSRLRGVPAALDVLATATCLAALSPNARRSLDLWVSGRRSAVEGGGSTWNVGPADDPVAMLEVEGEGVDGLLPPIGTLDCANSGTTMRLLTGLLAGRPFASVLAGDESLSRRPMERVAEPLRAMGSRIGTTDGHAPVRIDGAPLRGIEHRMTSPSAQVKSAVLLAGLQAYGRTTLVEPVATRDHTERALAALGASVSIDGLAVSIETSRWSGFDATVPGDPSSAAFPLGAAAVLRTDLSISGVGLNPTRLHYLAVLAKMGVAVTTTEEGHELGEPVGRLTLAAPTQALRATTVSASDLPLVIDEVPLLAAVAAHAQGTTRFEGVGELRIKESDRVDAIVRGIADLGGRAWAEGHDLVVAGGGLGGGRTRSGGDHRIAMAMTVAALGADRGCEIDGIDDAAVSFPGFVRTLADAGAGIEVAR
ncbi:MAG TPA: 3-phosphoshikimate 1-carboxyvinyltransferase [Actinomycetota bacterium]